MFKSKLKRLGRKDKSLHALTRSNNDNNTIPQLHVWHKTDESEVAMQED